MHEDKRAIDVLRNGSVKFSQSGLRRFVPLDDSDVAVLGSLLVVLAPASNKLPYVLWVPYTFLNQVAPDHLSPTASAIVAARTVGLTPAEDARKDDVFGFEQQATVCVPLSDVTKMHRRTNVQGRRTLVIERVGRKAADAPLSFVEGGSTPFFDEIRKYVDLRPITGQGREAWEVQPLGSSRPPEVSAAAGTGAAAAGEGNPVATATSTAAFRASASSTDPPPAATTSMSSAPTTPAVATTGATDEADGDAFEDDLYGRRPNNGGKGFIASTLVRLGTGVTKIGQALDRLVVESPVEDGPPRGDSDYDVVATVASPDELTPHVVPPATAPGFRNPLRPSQWNSCFDSEGRLNPANYAAARETAFRGGIDPTVRSEVWPFLLGVFAPDSTAEQREQLRRGHAKQYRAVKSQWLSVSDEQAGTFRLYRERRQLIEKDVARSDRRHPLFASDDSPYLKRLFNVLMTYSFFNFDLGYCQGMSDILVPLLILYEEEDMAFAVFKALLGTRLAGNFYDPGHELYRMNRQLEQLRVLLEHFAPDLHCHLQLDEVAAGNEHHHQPLPPAGRPVLPQVHSMASNAPRADQQLSFAFRMLHEVFKRELPTETIPQLWDVVFSCPFTPDYQVIMAAALLRNVSKQIIDNDIDPQMLTIFTNRLTGNVRVEDLVVIAADFYDIIDKHYAMRRKARGENTAGSRNPGFRTRELRPSLSDIVAEYTSHGTARDSGRR